MVKVTTSLRFLSSRSTSSTARPLKTTFVLSAALAHYRPIFSLQLIYWDSRERQSFNQHDFTNPGHPLFSIRLIFNQAGQRTTFLSEFANSPPNSQIQKSQKILEKRKRVRKSPLLKVNHKLNFSQKMMKIEKLLLTELETRFGKDNRKVLFVTRCKMFVHIEGQEWQENCSGLLVLFQKGYSYGFTIVSTIDLDINFDFELYSNFPNYTKYIGDLRCLIFLAPSQKNCLKVMFVLQSKTELSELKKQIDQIYASGAKNVEVDFFNQPQVQEILAKVPIEQPLLTNDLLFRQGVQDHLQHHFAKTILKPQTQSASGFKYYAIGRQQWKISKQQTQYLKSKNEAEIIQQLAKLQKQAKIRGSS